MIGKVKEKYENDGNQYTSINLERNLDYEKGLFFICLVISILGLSYLGFRFYGKNGFEENIETLFQFIVVIPAFITLCSLKATLNGFISSSMSLSKSHFKISAKLFFFYSRKLPLNKLEGVFSKTTLMKDKLGKVVLISDKVYLETRERLSEEVRDYLVQLCRYNAYHSKNY